MKGIWTEKRIDKFIMSQAILGGEFDGALLVGKLLETLMVRETASVETPNPA